MPFTASGVHAPVKALRSLSFRLRSAVGHADFTKFIVLSRSRTGSNMLVSLLNSHPGVLAEGEIFARLDGRDARKRLAKAYAKQPSSVKAKGFKVFYYHPLDGRSQELWGDLILDETIRVIHLKRRNILRTLISRKIAGLQDVWAATSDAHLDTGKPKAASFTASELEEGFRRTRNWETESDRQFARHPLLPVHYEDLVRDPHGSLAEVLDFLGLPHFPLATNMRRQNPERLVDLVTNYHEMKAAFSGTAWEVFFDE